MFKVTSDESIAFMPEGVSIDGLKKNTVYYAVDEHLSDTYIVRVGKDNYIRIDVPANYVYTYTDKAQILRVFNTFIECPNLNLTLSLEKV